MKNKSLLTFVSFMLLVWGCGSRTALEGKTSEIKPGMNQGQINVLFKNFPSSSASPFSGKLQNEYSRQSKTVAFQTNSFVGSDVNFGPAEKGFFAPFELCTVYFDTNKIVVGYHYSIDL